MTNSDYLFKATLKKLSEKLNQTFLEKIEDATIAAQEVPDILKKELEILKDEIRQEAEKMEKQNCQNSNENNFHTEDTQINIASSLIKEINDKLEILNNKLDS